LRAALPRRSERFARDSLRRRRAGAVYPRRHAADPAPHPRRAHAAVGHAPEPRGGRGGAEYRRHARRPGGSDPRLPTPRGPRRGDLRDRGGRPLVAEANRAAVSLDHARKPVGARAQGRALPRSGADRNDDGIRARPSLVRLPDRHDLAIASDGHVVERCLRVAIGLDRLEPALRAARIELVDRPFLEPEAIVTGGRGSPAILHRTWHKRPAADPFRVRWARCDNLSLECATPMALVDGELEPWPEPAGTSALQPTPDDASSLGTEHAPTRAGRTSARARRDTPPASARARRSVP